MTVCTARLHRLILQVIPIIFAAGFASVYAHQLDHFLDHSRLGCVDGWDYLTVDSTAQLLYMANGTRVEIVDMHTGKSVTDITGLKGTHVERSMTVKCMATAFTV